MIIKPTHDIDDSRINDLLTGHALGYSDWLLRIDGQWPNFTIKYDLPSGNEGDGKGRKRVGLRAIHRGMKVMAERYPSLWADFLSDEADDLTADAAWQCIALGELVYG